jgi:chromosome condensin MukBEF ATPase and DNA-binding subunit MukB
LDAAVATLREHLHGAEARRNSARDELEKFDAQVAEQNQLITSFDIELSPNDLAEMLSAVFAEIAS